MKVLVKLGGTLLDAAELAAARWRRRSPRRSRAGVEMVVVHGGGKQMTRFLTERGVESRSSTACASPRRRRWTPC